MQSIKTIFFVAVLSILSLACNTNKQVQAEQNTPQQEGGVPSVLSGVIIKEKWQLPSILEEVSGVAYLGNHRFACVQDELGTIFIYNTRTSQIEKEVPFAGEGDYEGLALAGETAYVVKSDGTICEVKNWMSEKPATSKYGTRLTEDHNVEGLCYDQAHNRLLLAIKGEEPGNKLYKGIYAFDLAGKKLANEPVFKIDLKHSVFQETKTDELQNVIQPSEINLHPLTGDFYITDAKNYKILILDSGGEIKSLYSLNKDDFAQAEGVAFSPSGELFISNEGKNGSANILKVVLPNPQP